MQNPLQIRYPKLYALICTPLFIAALFAVYFYMDAWVFPVMIAVYICILLHLLLYRLDFDQEAICIQYFLLLCRRITADRISSVQIVSIGSIPTLIICIDGHRPYLDFCDFKWFFHSFRVIRMQLLFSAEKQEKYVAELEALYGNKVTVEKSYQKHFRKNQK